MAPQLGKITCCVSSPYSGETAPGQEKLIPPNHAQAEPERGPAVPPPFPQSAAMHRGVTTFVEYCDQSGLLQYPSKLASRTRFTAETGRTAAAPRGAMLLAPS